MNHLLILSTVYIFCSFVSPCLTVRKQQVWPRMDVAGVFSSVFVFSALSSYRIYSSSTQLLLVPDARPDKRTDGRCKSNMPLELFRSLGNKHWTSSLFHVNIEFENDLHSVLIQCSRLSTTAFFVVFNLACNEKPVFFFFFCFFVFFFFLFYFVVVVFSL